MANCIFVGKPENKNVVKGRSTNVESRNIPNSSKFSYFLTKYLKLNARKISFFYKRKNVSL